MLAMHYTPSVYEAFNSIQHIMRDVNYGWLLKYTHANGASAFFVCVYVHVARGLYYGSYLSINVWVIGVIILFLMMATAFIGYVLPWGQMSFWGATVITNFITAIPYVGQMIVEWIWGGYSVGNPTLNRFLSLHYLLPFILCALVFVHLTFLHEYGSTTPTGIAGKYELLPFHHYYVVKDALGFFFFGLIFAIVIFFGPNVFGDPENFIKANPLVTPVHIMPEWYFLFAYTILRTIPSKLGGVLMLVISILILLILPFIHVSLFKSNMFKPFTQALFWIFIANFLLLTVLGSKPVEVPFLSFCLFSMHLYFIWFFSGPLINKLETWFLH
jgi:ubiquinol-cytochrome c reductase cytochrome b subunit